ncbi:hypothetical protein EC957_005961, partial [Mortierella hygrophila]
MINSLLTGAFSDVKIKRTEFTHDQSRDKWRLGGMMPGILRHLIIIHIPTTPPSPKLDPSDTTLSKLMRLCPHLRVLSILDYTARIESFEQVEEWACQDLEVLYVKAQGLDEVDACLTKTMTIKN